MDERQWEILITASAKATKRCSYSILKSWNVNQDDLRSLLMTTSLSKANIDSTIALTQEALKNPLKVDELAMTMYQYLTKSYRKSLPDIIKSMLLVDNNVKRVSVRKHMRKIWNQFSDETRDIMKSRVSGKTLQWLNYYDENDFARNKDVDTKTEAYYTNTLFKIMFEMYYDNTFLKNNGNKYGVNGSISEVIESYPNVHVGKPVYDEILNRNIDASEICEEFSRFETHEDSAIKIMSDVVKYCNTLKCKMEQDFSDGWIRITVSRPKFNDSIVILEWQDENEYGTFYVNGAQVPASSVLDVVSLTLVGVQDV